MALTITNESKNNLDITNVSKDTSLTWAEATWTWREEKAPWAVPKLVVSKESKNTLNITNENKN